MRSIGAIGQMCSFILSSKYSDIYHVTLRIDGDGQHGNVYSLFRGVVAGMPSPVQVKIT